MSRAGLIVLKEAEQLCQVSSKTIRRWVEEDGMPLTRLERKTAIHWKELHKCLLRRGLPIPPELESGPRILLVGTESDSLILLIDTLEGLWEKARVATAGTREKGLHKLMELRPQLLIVDLQLPNLAAIELCRWIRQTPELANTKILAVMDREDLQTTRTALETGADEYLTRPLTSEAIGDCATRLLGDSAK